MMSDIEVETLRLIFEVENELLMMKLREMIEKTILLEKCILNDDASNNETFVDPDSYKPCKDIEYPPKKKMKN